MRLNSRREIEDYGYLPTDTPWFGDPRGKVDVDALRAAAWRQDYTPQGTRGPRTDPFLPRPDDGSEGGGGGRDAITAALLAQEMGTPVGGGGGDAGIGLGL